MKRKNLQIRHWLAGRRNKVFVAIAIIGIIVAAGAAVSSLIGKSEEQEPSYEPIVIEGGSELLGREVSGSASPSEPKKSPPRFDKYVGMPMDAVAKELGVSYDANTSRQIKAVKDDYSLVIEDGGKDNPTNPLKSIETGKVTYSAIELSEMGTCSQAHVYDRIDEAMVLVGLDPATKGERHTGNGLGYGAFRGYQGQASTEIALQCLYDGDRYELVLKVLPEYR